MSFPRIVAATTLAVVPLCVVAAEPTLTEVVVTAPQMRAPLIVVNDPKAPQQPVPSSDGASFLKNIPGFSSIRKAGTDGDPVLRGLAGSRLSILLDGAEFHGGCGMRMDPPTAYVFPETYDRVTVIKGPQSVRYGNGNLAGVVLFERETQRFEATGARAHAGLTAGSWGRRDGAVDAAFGTPDLFLRTIVTHSEADDYEDGDGRRIHSSFQRRSLGVAGGWTPDRDTRIEFSAVRSEAKAAYADRGMDGSVFDRDGFGLKFDRQRISDVVRRVRLQADWNYIDHVMDNYSLRAKPAPAAFMWSNPDRETLGLRGSIDLAVGDAALLTLGVDRRNDRHTVRSFSGALLAPVGSRPRGKDFESDIIGSFAELAYELSTVDRVIGGVRRDRFSAERFNPATGANGAEAAETLASGFVRYERDLRDRPATVYLGIGRAERPMDHWEATTWNGLTAARRVNPERNTQLDAGLLWNGTALTGSLSAFWSRIDDYLLTFTDPALPGSCGMNPAKCTTLNVDAARRGFEADLAWAFARQWTLRASYALVRADNETMDVPLAQTPPAEAKLGLAWGSGPWTAGVMGRFVRAQDRVHRNYGSIVGQDIGESSGFATFALNTSYRFGKRLLLSAGIDNVFDRNYAEHISRAAVAVAGFDAPTVRVQEPGRFVWTRLTMTLD